MSFVGKVLTYLMSTFKFNPALKRAINRDALLTIDRKGFVVATSVSSPQYRFPAMYSKHGYTENQIRKFNERNYSIAHVIEFSNHPEDFVAHLLAISIKEKSGPSVNFAAIDISGKVYAYSNYPKFNENTGKWEGNVRKFICRLEGDDFRPYIEPQLRVFNLNGWNVSYCSPDTINAVESDDKIELKDPELIDDESPIDINYHIKARVNRINEDQQKINELTGIISISRDEIDRLNHRITAISSELTALVKAAKIMGVANG